MICPRCKSNTLADDRKKVLKCSDWLCNWSSSLHYLEEFQKGKVTRDVRRTTATR